MHFIVPASPPVSSQAFFKLPLLPLSAPPPPHPAHPIPLALALSPSLALYLSHSLTEADVGQCVWSLSGAGESLRAPCLVLIDPGSDYPS